MRSKRKVKKQESWLGEWGRIWDPSWEPSLGLKACEWKAAQGRSCAAGKDSKRLRLGQHSCSAVEEGQREAK